VADLAGEDGSAFFRVESQLGLGFFILIGYCVCGGFVHYFFGSAVSEFFQLDPHHKIDPIWTLLLGPCLKPVSATIRTRPSLSSLERNQEISGVFVRDSNSTAPSFKNTDSPTMEDGGVISEEDI